MKIENRGKRKEERERGMRKTTEEKVQDRNTNNNEILINVILKPQIPDVQKKNNVFHQESLFHEYFHVSARARLSDTDRKY